MPLSRWTSADGRCRYELGRARRAVHRVCGLVRGNRGRFGISGGGDSKRNWLGTETDFLCQKSDLTSTGAAWTECTARMYPVLKRS